MFSESIRRTAQALIERCEKKGVRLVLAESCTGGLIAAAITAIPGASRVVDRGFVVYSNESKEQELSVPSALIEQYGAVSEPVVIAMARGALERAKGHAQMSIAVTGVAGPDGTPTKPAGLVHIAVEWLTHGVVHERHEFGNIGRDEVREMTVLTALKLATNVLTKNR